MIHWPNNSCLWWLLFRSDRAESRSKVKPTTSNDVFLERRCARSRIAVPAFPHAPACFLPAGRKLRPRLRAAPSQGQLHATHHYFRNRLAFQFLELSFKCSDTNESNSREWYCFGYASLNANLTAVSKSSKIRSGAASGMSIFTCSRMRSQVTRCLFSAKQFRAAGIMPGTRSRCIVHSSKNNCRQILNVPSLHQ